MNPFIKSPIDSNENSTHFTAGCQFLRNGIHVQRRAKSLPGGEIICVCPKIDVELFNQCILECFVSVLAVGVVPLPVEIIAEAIKFGARR